MWGLASRAWGFAGCSGRLGVAAFGLDILRDFVLNLVIAVIDAHTPV